MKGMEKNVLQELHWFWSRRQPTGQEQEGGGMHTFRFKLRLFLPVESPHLMFQEPWEVKRFAAGCWLQWPPWKFLRGERVGGGTGRGRSEASGEEPCRISESQPGRRGNCGRDGGRPPLAGTPLTHVCVCV